MSNMWFCLSLLKCFLRRPIGILLYFLFTTSTVSAQKGFYGKVAEDYYSWFDEQVEKESLPLYIGIGYVEKYKVINKYHKFFKSTGFLKGSLIYDGQLYPDLEMKYDLDEDLILLNLRNGQRIVLLQPNQDKIERFEIDGKYFIHINDGISKARETSGYYELLYEGTNLQLHEKHTKKRFERKGRKSLYYEFKSRNKNYLFYKGEHYVLKDRKDFENVFPEFKREIQGYSKKRFPKENRHAHLITISRRIDELINKLKVGP